MALIKSQWDEIEVIYKIGDMSIRDIASQFGITHGAIQQRAKRQNWERGSMKMAVNELAKANSQISHIATPEQLPIINKIVQDKTQMANQINNVFAGALQLHQSILSGTAYKLQSGEIDELQASKVISSLGYGASMLTEHITAKNDEDKTPEKPHFTIEINPVAGLGLDEFGNLNEYRYNNQEDDR